LPYRKFEFTLYAIVILLSAGVGVWSERQDFRLQIQTQVGHVAVLNQGMALRLERNIAVLAARASGLAAVVQADPNLSREAFTKAAERITADSRLIRSVTLATNYIVRHVYPTTTTPEIVGIDYRTLPEQIRGVEAARASATPILLGPSPLVQGGRGLIMRLVFGQTADADQTPTWNMVSIAVDEAIFFGRVDLPEDDHQIATVITRADDNVVILGDAFAPDQDPVTTAISTPSGEWLMASAPVGGWSRLSSDATTIAMVALARILVVIAVLRGIFGLLRQKHRAEERLVAAIDALDEGFALFDPNGRLALLNRRYREIYKTSEDLLVPGRTFEEIIRGGVARGQYPEAKGHEEDWIKKRLADHLAADHPVEQRLDDGRWLKVAERRTSDGSIVGFRVDVTELKKAIVASQAASRAKSDFISVLSHELRTPLTIVLGYAKLLASVGDSREAVDLRRSLGSDRQKPESRTLEAMISTTEEMAGKALAAGQHLLALIDDLLDFSKIEAGKVKLELASVSISEVVADTERSFDDLITEKGLYLRVRVDPVIARADPIRLKQVLINLLSNAVKFSEAGGISIETEVSAERVKVSVTDTGCGIPEDQQARIFQPFERVAVSSTRRSNGTGLGLAICKRFVQLMDGEIGFDSTPGVGSTFWFTLPLDRPEEAGLPDSRAQNGDDTAEPRA
jgi:two-component system cell cycle sensor histidine kinase PleC